MTESPQSLASTYSSHQDQWLTRVLLSEHRPRRKLVAMTYVLVLMIGVADFIFGFELSFAVFYTVPVCLAVASINWRFGVIIAGLSTTSALVGDYAAGASYKNIIIPIGNTIFTFCTYLVVIWLFTFVIGLRREMEERVRQRTAALQNVISERDRLEKAILEISERERRSIGHDLHDGLGQHLTGTAFVGQILEEKLVAKQLVEEQGDAHKIVGLIEEAIEKTRRLAKGLLLSELRPDGLVDALQDLAADITAEFRTQCEFHCNEPIQLPDSATATHLFHITQEAVHNAIRHAKAPRIIITLGAISHGLSLKIADNGPGLPDPSRRGRGLGLSIMAHRADIVGWRFSIDSRKGEGTTVTCVSSSLVRTSSHA